MKKRALALLLATVMLTSSFAACKKDDDKTKAPEKTEGAKTTLAPGETKAPGETEEATTQTVPANVITGDENADNPFYVYSWNTEIGDRLKYFLDDPENADVKDRIIYVNTGGTDHYQGKMDALLGDTSNKQYPDLMGLEADYILKYTGSKHILPIADLGITEEDYKEMYQYTLDIATADGVLKGLSWQAAPGAMIYRTDYAEKVFGTSKPEDIQKEFATWDKMLEAAEKIKNEYGEEVALFSGPDDVARVFMAARKEAWVDADNKLVIDPELEKYLDFNKALYENEYTKKTTQWSDAWNANAKEGVFAYMGCTWFLQWTIKPNSGGNAPGEGSYGLWNMCQGPQPYYWGGTWLSATAGCSDKELAGRIIKYMTCNEETLKTILKKDLDYVNSAKAVQAVIDEMNDPANKAEAEKLYDFLGGQNHLEVFKEWAEDVEVKITRYDLSINGAFQDAVTAYAQGTLTKEKALEQFKKTVKDTYEAIEVE